MDGDADDIDHDIDDDRYAHKQQHAEGLHQEHGERAQMIDAAVEDAHDIPDLHGDGCGALALGNVVRPHGDGRDEAGLLVPRDAEDAVHGEVDGAVVLQPAEGNDIALLHRLTLLVGIERLDEHERAFVEAALVFALHIGIIDGDGRNVEYIGEFVGIERPLDDERDVDRKQRDEDDAQHRKQHRTDDAPHGRPCLDALFPRFGFGCVCFGCVGFRRFFGVWIGRFGGCFRGGRRFLDRFRSGSLCFNGGGSFSHLRLCGHIRCGRYGRPIVSCGLCRAVCRRFGQNALSLLI